MILLALACSQPTDIQASLADEVATVVRVTWEGGPARVDYGLDGLDQSTPVLEGEALLLGLPADTSFEYQIVPEAGKASDLNSFQTGSLPQELPLTQSEGQHEGFGVTTVLGGASAAIVLDAEGRIVWYRLDDRGLDTYRARLSVDGQSLLYNAGNVSGEIEEDTEIVRVSWDGTVLERIAVPRLAHDFVELADGTLIAMAVEVVEHEGEDFHADTLVEVAPDGTQSTIWSSLDCFEPELGEPFANALDVSADESKLLLSTRNFSDILQIDRASGSCDWVFGQTAADFAPSEQAFLNQHQFELLGDTILVFDNEGLAGNQSRAIEYSFDPEEGLAEPVWSYAPTPSVYSFVLGDVHRFEDGDTLVTFSAGGQLDRVDAQGERVWQMNTDIGYALGFHQWVPDLYEPGLP